MNCEEFNVPDLHLALVHVKEAARCILHTVLFNRALGPQRGGKAELDGELGLLNFAEVRFRQCVFGGAFSAVLRSAGALPSVLECGRGAEVRKPRRSRRPCTPSR